MGSRSEAGARTLPAAVWATLRSDALARAAVVAFAATAPAGLVPWLTAAQKERLIFTYLPVLFIGLAVAALKWGLGRLAGGEERHFWNDLALAFGAWLGVRILYVFYPEVGRPLAAEITAESLFAVFYAAFVLALERQPHRTDRWRPSGLEGNLVRPAVALLVLGLAAYFVVIPAAIDRESYDSLVPSMVLYLTLDLFLVTRTLLLVRAARSQPRWRAIYAGLALVAALATASDALEYLEVRGISLLGLATEPLWNLTFVALVVTARLRHRPFPEPLPRPAVPGEGYVSGPSSQTLVFALAFPLIHLACYSWGIFGPQDRGELARELVVVGAILVLGAIAFLQHRQFGRRTRRLAEQRLQMEATLRKSASDLHLMRQRRRTREELQRAEEEFIAFFRFAPGWRLISRLGDGRVIEVNEHLADATGLGRSEILDRPIEDLFRWSADAERAGARSALRDREALRDLELELAGRSGERTVLLSGEPVDLAGERCRLSVLCDVTGSRWRGTRGRPTALDLAAAAVSATDRDGRIRFWNRAAERLYGWPAAEALGRSGAELLPTRRPAEDGRQAAPGVAGIEEVVQVARGGGEVRVGRRRVPLHDASGKAEGELVLSRPMAEVAGRPP